MKTLYFKDELHPERNQERPSHRIGAATLLTGFSSINALLKVATASIIILTLVAFSACGGKNNPTAPTAPSVTRIITLSGALNIGNVPVGSSGSSAFSIRNDGNSPLTVSGLAAPCASSLRSNMSNGTIIASGTQLAVTVTFTPTTASNCNGTLTVNGDQTSGTNTLPIIAIGTFDGVPLFTKSGFGNTVFTLPAYVGLVRVTGHFVDTGSNSNFIVHLNGFSLINEILRGTDYSGTHLTTGGGLIEIVSSGSIDWTFTEVR